DHPISPSDRSARRNQASLLDDSSQRTQRRMIRFETRFQQIVDIDFERLVGPWTWTRSSRMRQHHPFFEIWKWDDQIHIFVTRNRNVIGADCWVRMAIEGTTLFCSWSPCP